MKSERLILSVIIIILYFNEGISQEIIKDTLYFNIIENNITQSKVEKNCFIPNWNFNSSGGDFFYFEVKEVSLGTKSYKASEFSSFIESSKFFKKESNSVDFSGLQNFLGKYYQIYLVNDNCSILTFIDVNVITEIE